MSLFIYSNSFPRLGIRRLGRGRGLLVKTSPSDAARWLAQTALQLEGGQITRPAPLSGPPPGTASGQLGREGQSGGQGAARLGSWAWKGTQLR